MQIFAKMYLIDDNIKSQEKSDFILSAISKKNSGAAVYWLFTEGGRK